MLGLGLAISPTLLRAADEPPKENPPARPERPGGGDQPGRGPGAQGGQRGQFGDPAAQLDRWKEAVGGLKLTDEQKPKVDAALATAKKGFDDLKANPPEGRERFTAMQKITTDLRTSVLAVLTDDQKKELEAKMPQRGGFGGRGGAGGGGMLTYMKQNLEQLGLSDEQKPKVEAAFKDAQEKLDAVMKEAQAGGDRAAIREKMTPITADLQKKLEEILTPEQKEKQAKQREEMQKRFQQNGGGQGGRGNRGGAPGAPAQPQPEKKEL